MEQLYARDLYGKALLELGKKDPDIVVLDADLSGSTRTAASGAWSSAVRQEQANLTPVTFVYVPTAAVHGLGRS